MTWRPDVMVSVGYLEDPDGIWISLAVESEVP